MGAWPILGKHDIGPYQGAHRAGGVAIPPATEVKPDVVYEPLANFTMTVFVRAGHPLATAGGTPGLGDLARHPWLAYQSDAGLVRRLHDRFLSAEQEPPRIAVEASSLLACFSIAGAGDFVLCLAAPLQAEAERHGLVRLPVALWSFRSGAWLHASARTRPAARDLIKLLRQAVHENGGDFGGNG